MEDASEEYFIVNCNACEHDGEFKKAADYCRACREYMCRDCLKYHNKLAILRDHKDKLIGSQPFIDMTKSRSGLPSSISSEDAIFCCHGCATNGDIREAADFCLECAEYFCSTCLMNHNRWTKHTDKLFGQDEMKHMIDARNTMSNTQPGSQMISPGSRRTGDNSGARPKTKAQPIPSSSRTDTNDGSRPKTTAQPAPPSNKASKVDGSSAKAKMPSTLPAHGKGTAERYRSTVRVDACKYPSIRVDQDKSTCYAQGSCPLDDGGSLVTDYNNRRLKRLDSRLAVVECVDLPDVPWAVCSNSTEAAVCLPGSGTIAIVSLEGSMRVVRQIQVGGWCEGVAWHRGEWLCGVGSSPCVLKRYGADGEERGSTQIVDENGKYINGEAPGQIVVQNDRIFITLGGAGLVIVDAERFTTVKVVKEFDWTSGVCVGEAGDVFVCGQEPAGPGMSRGPWTVKQFNKDGEFINTIISEEQLKHRRPRSLSYIRERSILVVTLDDSDEFCAFFLK